jgi:lipopolysaccharide transport system ATP-binding protein
MPETAIEFINVSKRYFIGQRSLRTLHNDIAFLCGGFLKKENGFDKKLIWGLKDVNFTINQCESVGIIGPNGSGKTTIFKLISHITYPTEGKVIVNGKVGSLIDLYAGFHPELTGLENIYLNAAIRGMPRRETRKRLDEILSFAGIERFKDTPIKHYSAGMCMRLGFSVAMACPFDILLIDEVLTVGDVGFQEKCISKILEIRNAGKTLCFVSHDTDKIKKVCERAIYLSFGNILMDNSSPVSINRYLGDAHKPRQ